MGDEKYFHAARDYIYENNTKFHVGDWVNGSNQYRVITMLERLTAMDTYDSFPSSKKGIGSVMASNASQDVIINGNQCFFNDGTSAAFAFMTGKMTDRCHGRIVSGGSKLAPPSDDRTTGLGSPLAGPLGAYIAQSSNGSFSFKGGIVPDPGYSSAMGGLSTYYAIRSNERSQLVGRVSGIQSDNIVFTASQVSGSGGVPTLKDDAISSGVASSLIGEDSLLGGRGAELLCLDGSTSVAVAYKNPVGSLKLAPNVGSKHTSGYYVNTYLMFKCQKPR